MAIANIAQNYSVREPNTLAVILEGSDVKHAPRSSTPGRGGFCHLAGHPAQARLAGLVDHPLVGDSGANGVGRIGRPRRFTQGLLARSYGLAGSRYLSRPLRPA